jgi:hypothetical protein
MNIASTAYSLPRLRSRAQGVGAMRGRGSIGLAARSPSKAWEIFFAADPRPADY